MTTMQAVRIHAFGEQPFVEEVPRPEPKHGQVLVEVKATGVNPLDWVIAEGKSQDWLPHRLPLTLGWELAGIVAENGPGATRFKPDDQVFALADYTQDGVDAQYALVDESALALKPKTLTHTQAAAIPVGALTAWMALFDAGKLDRGQTVLIHGAAGGVGSMAVQLAKSKGARVIGTASVDHLDMLFELGCDRVIEYHSTPFERELQGEAIDVVIDSIGGDTQARSFGLLKPGGRLIALTDEPDQDLAKRHDVEATLIGVRPDGGRLEQIAYMIDEGKLHPRIYEILPMSQASQALKLSKTRHVGGKIILTP